MAKAVARFFHFQPNHSKHFFLQIPLVNPDAAAGNFVAVQYKIVLLAAGFANLRLATSTAAFIAAPAFAFCGLTFPTAAMPLQAKVWGAILPLTHYLGVLVDQVMRGAPASASLPKLAALAGFVLVLPVLSHYRLARVLGDERYWGRQ
jgi:hypothetical protein